MNLLMSSMYLKDIYNMFNKLCLSVTYGGV